jgi:hypothetical protein
MVHFPESSTYRGAKRHPGVPALALRTQPMATTLVSVETREVCAATTAAWFSSGPATPFAERCHRPLDVEEPVPLAPQLVPPVRSGFGRGRVAGCRAGARNPQGAPPEPAPTGRAHAGAPHLHFENRKRQGDPHSGLAGAAGHALEVDVCHLVRDARSRRDEEVASILADPFLAEIAALLPIWTRCTGRCSTARCGMAALGRRRTA